MEMGNVLDFNERMAAKKEHEEMVRWKNFFLEQFGNEPKETMMALMKAIQEKDEKKYMEIANPILLRNAKKEVMKEFSENL